MSEYSYFNLDVQERVAHITMNREPLNVLHNPMMAEFNSLLESILSRDDLSALVIGAAGKVFSAGVDVSDHSADKVADMIAQFHGIFRKLASTDALTISAVQGAALGGGCELACFCDMVLASERAKFGQPEVQVGVFPPVAACVLPMQIGIKKAIEFNALGQTIDAKEAYRIGMVNAVYPTEAFDQQVSVYLDGIRNLSCPIVRMAKRATCMAVRQQVLAQLDKNEALYLGELMTIADAHEGIAAFLEKRKPTWQHA